MDAKQLRRFKADQIATYKTWISQMPEIKSEYSTEEAEDTSVRLNQLVTAAMNPDSLIEKLTVKDVMLTSIFKRVFHTPLSTNLQNKVTYSLLKNRRKISTADFTLVTTYHCFDGSAIKKFLPTIEAGTVGFDSDYSLLITMVNWEGPFIVKYNWHQQEITLQFDVDKWRGNIVNGQFVGNMI